MSQMQVDTHELVNTGSPIRKTADGLDADLHSLQGRVDSLLNSPRPDLGDGWATSAAAKISAQRSPEVESASAACTQANAQANETWERMVR